MYNLLEKIRAGIELTDGDRVFNNKALVSTLKQIHDELDAAVFEAYGWEDLNNESGKPKSEVDELILERLVALNAQRAEEERNGLIRWLRPEYQAPGEVQTQQIIEGVTEIEVEAIAPVEQQKFPKAFKDQLAAVRDLLRTQGGMGDRSNCRPVQKRNPTKASHSHLSRKPGSIGNCYPSW